MLLDVTSTEKLENISTLKTNSFLRFNFLIILPIYTLTQIKRIFMVVDF